MNKRAIGPIIIGLMLMMLLAFLVVPMVLVGGAALLFAGGAGTNCSNTAQNATQPTTTQSPQYAVTVASSGGTWQVTDLELAGVGNQGLGTPGNQGSQ